MEKALLTQKEAENMRSLGEGLSDKKKIALEKSLNQSAGEIVEVFKNICLERQKT